jgi:uncharacterized SAM-dependent methyltransferase
MTSTKNPTLDNPAMDRLGLELARMLNDSASALPADITERLRAARMQALAAQNTQMAPQVVAAGHSLILSDPPGQSSRLWRMLASLLPLLALMAGLMALQISHKEQIVQELAEIDAALLVDDLPPAAYTDPGFMQYLRHTLGNNTPQD